MMQFSVLLAFPRLQQASQHTTTVEIASMDKTLISVSPSSVTFTASNWSTPQYVNLTAGEGSVLVVWEKGPGDVHQCDRV